jgi:hypothetical protein
MSRRAALPGAKELFRATPSGTAMVDGGPPDQQHDPAAGSSPTPTAGAVRTAQASREPSGRERHEEKITVYLSADELVLLDEAKYALYREQGLKVDRGRIVREAVAVVVSDLAAKGEASILARRLRER